MTDSHDSAMNDVHALSGPYAVNALDADERERFELHLNECEACQREVDGLMETAAALAETVSAEPPASLRAQVLTGIDAVRPLPPLVKTPVADAHVTRPRRSLRIPRLQLALAAAFLGVAVAGLGLIGPWTNDRGPDVITAADVFAAPDATRQTTSLDSGAKVTVTVAPSLDKAVVTTRDLPAAPDGKVYEMWLQADGALTPAGFLPDDADATILVDGGAADATALGVTVEPSGGSDQPTTQPFIWFDLA